MKIKKNGKVIKLTESDLKKIVKKVLLSEAVTSDDNLRGVKVKYPATLRGNKTYKPNEEVQGHFVLQAAPSYSTAIPSGSKWEKGLPLKVYSMTYNGVKCDFTETAKEIKGFMGKTKQVEWKVPFKMTVTPEVVKALEGAKDKNRIELGKIKLNANISGFNEMITLSAFPTQTNINAGASASRD
jgi:hypothetical protein